MNQATKYFPGYETVGARLRKRWLYILPAVFVTYSLAYLDRANYGFGAAAGLASTLNITGTQSSLLGALFFLGYFLFQIPGTRFVQRRSARWVIFATLILWGSLAALTGVIRNFWSLAMIRFLLGVAESAIFPAMLVLLANWFTREERARANSLLILGNPITVLWMSAVTGYLIEAFGWQWTFVLEGIPSVVWAFVWVFVMRDKPAEAGWLGVEAATALNNKLDQEQKHIAAVGSWYEALRNKDVVMFSAVYFLWSLGIYGFVIWLPTIVRRGGSLSMGKTGLLSAVPYLASIGLMLAASYVADKTMKRRLLVWPFLLVAGVALFGSFALSDRSFALAFACLVAAGGCMYAPYGPFWAIIAERIPRNVLPEVMAVVNSAGALGAFVGSFVVGVLESRTGSSRPGFLLMSLALIGSSALLPRAREERGAL